MNGDMTSSGKNATLAVRNVVFGLFSVLTQLLGNSLTFFVIARIPSVEISDFGILTYAFAASQLFAVFFEYGMVSYLAKENAAMRERDYEFERAGYGLHLCLMIAGYTLFIITMQHFLLNDIAAEVCNWIGASVFLTSTLRFFLAFYQGREKLHLEFFSTTAEMLVLVSVIGIAYLQNADILMIAQFFFFGRLIAWVVVYIIFGFSDSWLFPRIDLKIWRKILYEALPFGLMFLIAFSITSIDTLMLQWMTPENPEHQVGLYQAALRLILMPTILTMVATKVFLPQLSRMGAESPVSITSNLRHLNNFLQSIGVMAGIFTIYHADNLVSLAYGKQYNEAVDLVRVLGITLILRFGAAYNLFFTLNGKMWLRVLFAITALLATVMFNYILIPNYGALGVAYASVLSHMVYWFPFLVAMKIYAGEPLLGWEVRRSVIAGLTFFILLMLTDRLPFLLNLFWSASFIFIVSYFSINHALRSRLLSVIFKPV